jgi:putative transposase
MDEIKGDERILGDSDFILSVLKTGNEQLERKSQPKVMGIDQDVVARRAAKLFGIAPEEIFIRSRKKQRVGAHSVFCYWAVQGLGLLRTHITKKLKLTPAGVCYAVMRGRRLYKSGALG